MLRPNKLILVLLLSSFIVFTSLPSNAFGARAHGRIVGKYSAPAATFTTTTTTTTTTKEKDEMKRVDWRMLKANTNDYGSYDPTPALSKPAFKLIPN